MVKATVTGSTKGHDGDYTVEATEFMWAEVVIVSKHNHKTPGDFDKNVR